MNRNKFLDIFNVDNITDFECLYPTSTFLPLEIRFPFFDKRLIEYMANIPTVQWCINKNILKQSVKNDLPKAVIYRPKTGVTIDRILISLESKLSEYRNFEFNAEIREYIDLKTFVSTNFEEINKDPELFILPFALNYWLCHN